MSAEDLMKKVGELAHYYELTYHGCSQCVLKALQDSFNVGDNLTFKAATALAGGIARMGETCGALTGGIMAISVVYGRNKLEETNVSKDYLKAVELSMKLYEQFKQEFGSSKCSDVQKKLFGRSFDLRSEEDRQKFVVAGGYGSMGCPQVVKKGAMLAARILLEGQ